MIVTVLLRWRQGETSISLEDEMAADMLVTVYENGAMVEVRAPAQACATVHCPMVRRRT